MSSSYLHFLWMTTSLLDKHPCTELLWQQLEPKKCGALRKPGESKDFQSLRHLLWEANCYAEWNLTRWKSPNLKRSVFSQPDRLWGHLSWGKWSHRQPKGALLSRNSSGIPQQMNHSSGKSIPVCTIKREIAQIYQTFNWSWVMWPSPKLRQHTLLCPPTTRKQHLSVLLSSQFTSLSNPRKSLPTLKYWKIHFNQAENRTVAWFYLKLAPSRAWELFGEETNRSLATPPHPLPNSVWVVIWAGDNTVDSDRWPLSQPSTFGGFSSANRQDIKKEMRTSNSLQLWVA